MLSHLGTLRYGTRNTPILHSGQSKNGQSKNIPVNNHQGSRYPAFISNTLSARPDPSFSGKRFEKNQLLSEEYPLVSVELEETIGPVKRGSLRPENEWKTQPSLLIQRLSNGDLNLVNSATRAKEPGLGPWTMHLSYPNPEDPHGPLKHIDTQNSSLVLPKSELSLVKKYQEPLQIWFSHPRIPQSDTPRIKIHASNAADTYTVCHF